MKRTFRLIVDCHSDVPGDLRNATQALFADTCDALTGRIAYTGITVMPTGMHRHAVRRSVDPDTGEIIDQGLDPEGTP